MRRVFYIVAFSVLAVGLAACGSSATPEPIGVTIVMSEYAFTPDDIELQVGQEVTFTLVNVGQLEHELMIGRDMMTMEGVPNGFMLDFFENAGVEPVVSMMEMHEDDHEEGEEHDEGMEEEHEEEAGHQHSGFMVLVPKENTSTLSFTATEEMIGEWEIACFLLDGVHYTAGMYGTLRVNK